MTPGRYYKVKEGCEGVCVLYREDGGVYVRVRHDGQYEIFNEHHQRISVCGCFEDEHLVQEKSLDMLSEGDVVVDGDNQERTVLFVHRPGLYVLSTRYGQLFTVHELAMSGFTIKGEPEQAKELTVAEISEKLGYPVKIVKGE